MLMALLNPVIRLCCYWFESFLRLLDNILDSVPRWALLLGRSLKSNIRSRWPIIWKLIDRTIVLPIQVMQAITDFQEDIQHPHNQNRIEGSSINLEGQIDNVVTIRLRRRSSPSVIRYEYAENTLGMRYMSAPITLDDVPRLGGHSIPTHDNVPRLGGHSIPNHDNVPRSGGHSIRTLDSVPRLGGHSIPTLDNVPRSGGQSIPTLDDVPRSGGQSIPTLDDVPRSWGHSIPTLDDVPRLGGHSVPTSSNDRLHESLVSSNDHDDSSTAPERAAPPRRYSTKHEIMDGNQFQKAGSDATSFKVDKPQTPMQNDDFHNSLGSHQPFEESPYQVPTQVHSPEETKFGHLCEDHGAEHTNAGTADAETPFISSDPTSDESFSPVALPIPPTYSQRCLASLPAHFKCSPQEQQRGEQFSSTPLATDTPTPANDHSSTMPGGITQGSDPNSTKWSPESQNNPSDIHPAWTNSFHAHPSRNSIASETTSSSDGSYPLPPRRSTQRLSEGDECTQTCISCEVCDRRHKRTHQSRIPRRVITPDHCDARSNSVTSCYSGKSMGSARTGTMGTIKRKKGPKRKVKVY
jgi:hypothetical protein